MKHFSKLSLSAASAILLLSACQSEQPVPADAPQTAEKAVTITGYLPSENDTKTVRDANGKIFWLHAEEISLFYASGDNGGSKFTSTNVALTSKAQFTGTIGVITGGSDENDGVDQNWFWGLYPYDATASCDGTYVYTTMKSSQIAQTGSFGDDTFITLGRSQGLSMSFYNVCGGIGFSVTRSDIKRVVLKGNGDETLGGRIKIGMGDDGKPFIADLTDGFTEIELTAPDGGTFTAGEYYYIPTVPVSLPSGFTLEFYTANAKGVYSFNSSLTVARSGFKRKASADAGVVFDSPLDQTVYGQYLYTGEETTYVKGTDQLSRTWSGGYLTFSIYSPAAGTSFEMSGIPENPSLSQSFTLTVSSYTGLNLDSSTNYSVTVAKIDEPTSTVWLTTTAGECFIVKK